MPGCALVKKDREARKASVPGLKKDWADRARRYQEQYDAQAKELVRVKREAREKGEYFVEGQPRVILATRIRGITCLRPEVRKTLQLLRLRQLHNAVFLKAAKTAIRMLRLVEPYITYGYPSRKVIHDLIYKRGCGRVNKQRIPLTSNLIISENLKKENIACMEDLVHEIYTCGPNFKKVNSFLWPFKLNSPRGGFRNKRKPYLSGGDWGNREQFINELVKRMI